MTEESKAMRQYTYNGVTVTASGRRSSTRDDKKYMRTVVKDGKEYTVHYGDPNLEMQRDNPERRANFLARHSCSEKKDPLAPGFWACLDWQRTDEGKSADCPDCDDCEDCDGEPEKAGRRMNRAMLKRVRDALSTLTELASWAGYEDATPDEDEMDDESKASQYAVKSIGPDRIGGYAVLWGGPDKLDVTGEYFSPATAELDAIFKAVGKLPILYHHAGDNALKTAVIGAAESLTPDNIGLWFEAQLSMAGEYKEAITRLIERGVLGVSTGTLPRARKVATDGQLTRWPIAEISLTPTPAEPRMMDRPVAAIKSAYAEIGLELPEEPTPEGAEDARQAAELEAERLALLRLTTDTNTQTTE